MAEDYYVREYKAAAEGRVGADRMAAGLSCIPNKIRGDLDEVLRLRAALTQIAGLDGYKDLPDAQLIAERALKTAK